jgi:hypothetical protein
VNKHCCGGFIMAKWGVLWLCQAGKYPGYGYFNQRIWTVWIELFILEKGGKNEK